jgi:hypothetical protein
MVLGLAHFMPIRYSVSILHKASEIAEKIESLQAQLDNLLNDRTDVSAITKAAVTSKVPVKRNARRAPEKTRQPRGTFAAEVREVLKDSTEPLRTAQIFEKLVKKGAVQNTANAKKVLGIRLYKLGGVKTLGGGLFGLAAA